MKQILLTVWLLCCAVLCTKAERVVFAPQWTPQSQFAGFYVAQEKGFFADEGLEVVFKHRSQHSSEDNLTQLMKGDVQITGLQLLQAVLARAQHLPVVNVMQVTQVSGLCCVSQHSISNPSELDGVRVGKWASGFSEFCDMLELSDGIRINWIPFVSDGINLFIFGAVDATLCYSYSELISLELSRGRIPEDQIIHFADFGYRCPEDGLVVTEDYLRQHPETVAAFVRAARKGWDYARENRQEALDITWKYVSEAHITTNREHQRRMLDTYLQLQENPATGLADYAPVSRSVFRELNEGLLKTGSIADSVTYESVIR